MSQQATERAVSTRGITQTQTFILALACGLIVANHYYAQTLVGLIATFFKIRPAEAGLIVTATQVGYGLGLLLLVPLGDIVENRRLVIAGLFVAAASLVAMSTARLAPIWLLSAFVLGLATTVLQVLIPYATQFTSDSDRGRVIGSLTSGIMLGIMLARPVASFVTYYLDWPAVFGFSAIAMTLTAVLLMLKMPPYQPNAALKYCDALKSLPRLLKDVPVLRRRIAYHTALFAAFSMFWITVPLLLAGPEFGYSQQSIGLFAFAGASGVVIAPIAGRVADQGLTKPVTGFAIAAVFVAFIIGLVGKTAHSVTLLVAAAILIDAGLVTNFVLSQRSIYGPNPESRSRIGGLFTGMFFIGGAAGSAIATASYAEGGWLLTSAIGMSCALLAFLIYATESTKRLRVAEGTTD